MAEKVERARAEHHFGHRFLGQLAENFSRQEIVREDIVSSKLLNSHC